MCVGSGHTQAWLCSRIMKNTSRDQVDKLPTGTDFSAKLPGMLGISRFDREEILKRHYHR